MRRNKKKNRVTVSGNIQRPGVTGKPVIILTQPQRFNTDISTYMQAVRSAENVDYPRLTRLYDLYSEILMDAHLTSVIAKRKSAVLGVPIEFNRNGTPDERINEQLRSPWFCKFLNDALDAIYWGASLCQFYLENKWINYDLVPRKHVDPVRQLILSRQGGMSGEPWENFSDLLFIKGNDELGLLAKAAPYVIYKRNNLSDWAQFAEIFGQPVREYTYDAADDDAREALLRDAAEQGGSGVFVHPEGSNLNFVESGNKTGSADLYDRFIDRCNAELSKLILGNTLTTETTDTGTQALGTVHKKVEEKIEQGDRNFILNLLNYEMTEIFISMGFDVQGGTFAFVESEEINPVERMEVLTRLKTVFNLPMDDNSLYEQFKVAKPADYNQQRNKTSEAAQKETVEKTETEQKKNVFTNLLGSFFSEAPREKDGALKW